jgi:hypothetical protein
MISRIMTLCIVLGITGTQAFAQTYTDTTKRLIAPKFAVKFSPLHLLAFYPTAQVAFETRVYQNLSFQLDVGPVLKYSENDSESYADKRGAKWKAEFRYYFQPAAFTDLYLAAEFFYNHVDFNRTSVFGIGCPSGNCDYFQYKTFKVEYREHGPSLKVGFMYYFDSEERFFIDFNGGVSLRTIRYHYKGKPTGDNIIDYSYDDYNLFGTPYEEDRNAYGLIVGYRVGYRFK